MTNLKFDESTGIYTSATDCYAQLPQDPHTDFVSFMLSAPFGDELDPTKVALINGESGKTATLQELRTSIDSLAQRFQQFGMKQHDVVMILLESTLQFPVIFNAIVKLGAVASMINPPASSQPEVERQIESSKAKFIITSEEWVSMTGKYSETLPVLLVTEDQLILPHKDDPNLIKSSTPVKVHQSDAAALLYSSGTTGMSKGVITSHGNLIAAMTSVANVPDEMAPSDTTLVLYPMSSMGGLVWLVCGAIFGRPQLIFLPRYNLHNALAAIHKYKVNKVACTPPVALDLLNSDTSSYDLSSLQTLMCAGAPLSKETMEAVLSKFSHLKEFIQLYGMTESTTLAGGGSGPLGSVGRCKPLVEAKVVDLANNKPLPPNQTGELLLRGPSIMKEYLNNPAATALAVEDGWLHTGDLGYFDNDGYLYIVDRLKEVFKCMGSQVAPAELEAILLTHTSITDCALVPFPDKIAGNVPAAYVVRSSEMLAAQDVMDFVTSQVPAYKQLRKVVFVDSIPKSATGKILRKELKLQLIQMK